jgi:hypothetical protein
MFPPFRLGAIPNFIPVSEVEIMLQHIPKRLPTEQPTKKIIFSVQILILHTLPRHRTHVKVP